MEGEKIKKKKYFSKKILLKCKACNGGVIYLEFMVELENRLHFVAELSETGTEAGHLLPAFIRDVDLVRVYFPEEHVHIHESLVEFLLQHF